MRLGGNGFWNLGCSKIISKVYDRETRVSKFGRKSTAKIGRKLFLKFGMQQNKMVRQGFLKFGMQLEIKSAAGNMPEACDPDTQVLQSNPKIGRFS